MPKKEPEVEAILIRDEIESPPSHAAELPEAVAVAARSQSTQKAPSLEEVLAYWTPGREKTMEVPQLMEAHRVKCAQCDAMLHYIPVAGQDGLPVLVCGAH